QVRGRREQEARERVLETRREDALVGTEKNDLRGGGRAPLLIQAGLDLHARACGERAGQQLRAPRALLDPQVERGARQDQRILQALAYLHPEPAVDAAVEELER